MSTSSSIKSAICLQCKKEFFPSPGNVAKGMGKYCDRFCFGANKRRPLEERFWDQVKKTDDAESCWEWTGSGNAKGYGHIFGGTERGSLRANRVAWELAHGPIPDGMLICHKCDNPKCCRADHLFLGTYDANNKDRARKGRSNNDKGEDHYAALMTTQKVLELRDRFAKGEKVRDLAKAFGIAHQTASKIARRKSWKHI